MSSVKNLEHIGYGLAGHRSDSGYDEAGRGCWDVRAELCFQDDVCGVGIHELYTSLCSSGLLKPGIEDVDHYDVKMPCHLILSKLAVKCPSAVLAVLDSLVDPLERTINHKPKLDAVKQEVDRNEDMIRSALRAIASLSRISSTYSFFADPDIIVPCVFLQTFSSIMRSGEVI
ncbi:uncharacterized protein A4U43_C02F15410 [Asparagus officinalis]|uniref:TATA-binding protein interacting (TIP20) domain-containing protein n=1 Tax=Asparagus officinalis TaxID=4686 RepID=A0A5P1FKD6_ASPOF|nr:uncharacterized protein A4U43_C02F15410 [Asparagus officinalis]